MDPLVSTRVSIRWPPLLAYEHTDVLVIQGRTGFYLDLRVFKSGHQYEGQVDWGTAGWKKMLSSTGDGESRASFTAILDNRQLESVAATVPRGSGSTREPPADEGTFTTLPNGDVLETGSMPNTDFTESPIQAYEEVWRRLEFSTTKDRVECRFLQREDEKAFWGRVDTWEVGMCVTDKNGFAAVRRHKIDGEWNEVYRTQGLMGTEFAWPEFDQAAKPDDDLSGKNEFKWKVIE